MAKNFHFWNYIKNLGRKGGPGPNPNPSTRKNLAIGMNVPFLSTFDDIDFFWEGSRNCNWMINGSNVGGLDSPVGSGANASTTGGMIPDKTGTLYGSVKMDPDGRIYPTNTLGVTYYTWNMHQFIEPGRVPNSRFELDLHGTGQISSLANLTIESNLGGGRYIVRRLVNGDPTTFNVLISTMDSGGIKPTIVPLDTAYSYDLTRLTTPEIAARIPQFCSYLRMMNFSTVNGDRCRGDTALTIGYRTQESRRPGVLMHADKVKMCNEAGVGMWFQVSHRDHLSHVAEYAPLLATLHSDQNFIEHGNEPWNQAGNFAVARCEIIVEGVRAGYHVPPTGVVYAHDWIQANCQPIAVKFWNNTGNESATSIALTADDNYFTATSAIGNVVVKALVDLPAGTNTPYASYSSSRAYLQGESFWISSALAHATANQQGVAGPAVYGSSTQYTNASQVMYNGKVYWGIWPSGSFSNKLPTSNLGTYWREATMSDPWVGSSQWSGGAQRRWDIVATASQADLAGKRWRSSRMRAIKPIIDAAFTAAGKPPPIYVANIQVGQNTSGALVDIDTQARDQLDWDDGHLTFDAFVRAPYLGGTTTVNNEANWFKWATGLYVGTSSNQVLTMADKLAAYTPNNDPALADGYLNTLCDKMLSPPVRAMLVDAHIRILKASQNNLAAYAVSRGISGSKTYYVGTYEKGWCGGISSAAGLSTGTTWPEERAGWSQPQSGAHGGVQWASGTTYAQDAFAFDGGSGPSGWTNTDLYRSMVAGNIGNRPSTDDGTHWQKVGRGSDGKLHISALMYKLMRHPNMKDLMREFDQAFRTNMGAGFITNFDMQNNMPVEPAHLASWGHMLDTADMIAPMIMAAIETNEEWKGLP